jgi:phage shock protein B
MEFEGMIALLGIFVGLPWLVLHYVTKWKTAPTLTVNDEALLDDLYQLARRLEDRVDTVERLVAADNPGFRPNRSLPPSDEVPASEIEHLRASKVRR